MISLAAARVRREVGDLDPGYGAWVMATGIVSSGLALFGQGVLSDVLLVVACAAFGLLVVAYAWRLVAYRVRVLADADDPGRAFGYFSLVAAANVLADRFALDGRLAITEILGLASVPVWLVLTYGILGAMIVGRRERPVLPRLNGSWFLIVVATESLAVTAATIAAARPPDAVPLTTVAVAVWGVGVVLYVMFAGLVTIRLLDEPATPHALSPTYWITMGATAISVLAAARILMVPLPAPALRDAVGVVSGFAFFLWAFGTWWIPLLLVFVIWRHGVRREPVRYDSTWWSMVFPLGMYAVASANYGRVSGLGFMVDIAQAEIWLGFVAWVGVATAMVASFLPVRSAEDDGRGHESELHGRESRV